jgi:O-antigen/teichoic acid export membrane protein
MNTLIELTRDSLFSVVVHLAPRFANVLLFILIGRLAGPTEAGVFTLAATYLIIFTTIMRGLDDLVIRQVSREPDQALRYLTNFLLLRLGLSLLLYCVLLFVVLVIFDYADSTVIFILILALSLVPDSLTHVAQAILLGQRRFGPPAITMTLVSLFKLVGGGLVLANGGNLQKIAWVWLAGSLLGMIVLLLVAARRVGWLRWANWLDWRPLARNWRATLPFLLITTMMVLEAQVGTVFLSAFRDEAEVGWYGAATTVAFSLAMFSQAHRMSVYPLMARYALQSPAKLSRLYKRSMRYLGMLILPMVAGIILLSPQIVSLVFGHKFQPTARVLRILIPSLVLAFLNVPNSRMMLVHDRQVWSLLFLVCSVTTNVLLNLVLAPSLGASGAAMARLCSSTIYFLLNHLYVAWFLMQSNLFWLLSKPALATLIMAVAVWLVRAWPLPLSIGVGMVTYTGTLWLVGGILSDDIILLRQVIAGWRNRIALDK